MHKTRVGIWPEQLYHYLLGLFLLYYTALLPFQPTSPPLTLAIMTLGALWLFSGRWREKFELLWNSRLAILFILYFAWVGIGVLYSPFPDKGLMEWGQKMPFFAWPVLLTTLPGIEKWRKSILQTLVVSAALTLLYYLILAFQRYGLSGDAHEFFFTRLVTSERVPPHYLGMMLNLAFALLLHHILERKAFLHRTLDAVLLLLFVLGIVLLAVRIQFAVLILISLILLGRHLRRSFSAAKTGLSLAAIALAMAGLIMSLPGSRARMIDTFNEVLSIKGKVNDKQTNPRVFLWRYAWEPIGENPILGVGTGAADAILQEALNASNDPFWDGEQVFYLRDRNYNYHNVFLQHLSAHGVVGFSLLLVLFLLAFYGWPSRFEARIFMLIALLSFCTESMLERQAGILYFSFFAVLLLRGSDAPQRAMSS